MKITTSCLHKLEICCSHVQFCGMRATLAKVPLCTAWARAQHAQTCIQLRLMRQTVENMCLTSCFSTMYETIKGLASTNMLKDLDCVTKKSLWEVYADSTQIIICKFEANSFSLATIAWNHEIKKGPDVHLLRERSNLVIFHNIRYAVRLTYDVCGGEKCLICMIRIIFKYTAWKLRTY